MIKTNAADLAFARCVKLAASYVCERCGIQHQEKDRGLHCSHYVGRGNWSVRFDPANAWAHCYGCHAYIGSRPSEFREWARQMLGDGRLMMLEDRARDTRLGRLARKSVKEIAKHYRNELAILKGRRDKGELGRLHFEAWV